MFSETTFLLVFGLGALCMLLGFFLVLRGIGTADSESSIKLIGIEIRASRVGPGVLFALFGVVLIVVALGKQPGAPGQAAVTGAPAAAPASAPAQSPPAAPTEAGTDVAAGEGAPDPPGAVAVDNTPVDPMQAQRNREAALLRQFLADAANGGCNPQILGPAPLMECNRNIGIIQPQLVNAGPVRNVVFLTSAQTPVGVADRFAVTHANGESVSWTGILGNDGRFMALVSP